MAPSRESATDRKVNQMLRFTGFGVDVALEGREVISGCVLVLGIVMVVASTWNGFTKIVAAQAEGTAVVVEEVKGVRKDHDKFLEAIQGLAYVGTLNQEEKARLKLKPPAWIQQQQLHPVPQAP